MTTVAAQPLEALAIANRVRSERAQLKRRLGRRELCVAELLRDPPHCLDTMPIEALLVAVPRMGRVKAGRVLLASGIPPTAQIGRLTYEQVERLIRVTRRCCPRVPVEREGAR